VVGVTVAPGPDDADYPIEKLKPIGAVLDPGALLPADILALAAWLGRYYLHEFSSGFLLALPALLRKGGAAELPVEEWVTLTVPGAAILPDQLKRSVAQQQLIALLQDISTSTVRALRERGFSRSQLTSLVKKDLITIQIHQDDKPIAPTGTLFEPALELNDEQQSALDAVNRVPSSPFLLEGVTGSGKTEVYLQAIERCLREGKRALVLVPEIGLTPQTIRRFQSRFQDRVVALHSGLSDAQRLSAWLQASLGQAAIVIGTRSAVLTPLPNLGLIVVDEEHDLSYKQQDSLRYQARDVALKRAHDAGIPIILGTATPSLESLHNAQTGRFGHLLLNHRAGGMALPGVETIDMRKQQHQNGLSERLLMRVADHLADGNQVLLFLNRRGYAPSWFCADCGWMADCVFCDAHLTHHRQGYSNICHHCGHREAPRKSCPTCHSNQVSAMGTGTERAEELLGELFPAVPVIRFDRDAASTRHKFVAQLERTDLPGPAIIVGTQMLAKGHHFERVTLVGIWDIDIGLFSADLRARERMGQLLTQVSGRSGRGERRGEVLIQTYYPDDPIFVPLKQHDYRTFANDLLAERQRSGLPPFGYLAVIRCDSAFADRAEARLQEMAHYLLGTQRVRVLGPIPALLSRRAGKHRFMLIVQSDKRSHLHQSLTPLHQHYPRDQQQVSWHIDIDPAELA
jgi:primosomal protein N' (replication factor Y)